MKLKDLIKRVGIFSFVFYIMTNTSFAAELSDIRTHNLDTLPKETIKQIDAAVQLLPEEIVDYYNQCGGEVYFVNGLLTRDGSVQSDLLGLYYLDTSDIYIRADNEITTNPSYSLKNSLIHEFGHFLYFKTYGSLSNESKQTLTNNYNYYNKYNGRCYDENETFAEMYSWVKGDMADVDENTINLYQEAEAICKVLLETENLEIGPGTISKIQELLKTE